MIDALLTFDPEKRITAKEALQHPWITNDEKPSADATNLAPGVLKGMHSQSKFKSVVTAMALLNQWKHLDLELSDASSDSDSDMDKTADQINKLDIQIPMK